ncbi:proton-conducting transporter membrane subunit [Cyanobium gracile]|uniref:Proton-conducting transporter membrane subunit n=1 Tax=Cyanobium gracile UHCC 0281 TaxID=3110309 RepID=A0ABU5SZ60_9CYAN|nr:proton-conducting transporter membrane subunit [Cyanobium gracile]MEA5443809.1 proton-conducting transporter membrane subunit [Cyanobium gracile UHCC 0281]
MPPVSGQTLLIGWLLLPFMAAFLAALLPPLARWLALACCLATGAVAAAIDAGALPASLHLLGPYGVVLQPDALAAPFLLLDALVCGAVVLDGWRRPMPGPFLLLLMVLHGGLASAFVAVDLISLYVTLEVVGISAFLLILITRSDRSLWLALRYLLIGNTVMTLYLIGAAVVYLEQGSFRLEAAATAGAAALALLLVGLLTKAGLFLSGLWLPRTHAEAPAEVSALLSGVVVAAGVVPLLRLAAVSPALAAVLPLVGVASAGLGLLFALFEADAKRLLAWSTLSQMGLVVLAPAAGGLYALGHGLAKAALFLVARRFPGRDLADWAGRPLPAGVWGTLWISSLSIVGVPPLLGFFAKSGLEKALPVPTAWLLSLLAVGTAAVYARLWGAPLRQSALPPGATAEPEPAWSPGVVLLLAALVLLGAGEAFRDWSPALVPAAAKAAVVLAVGVGLHRLLQPLRRIAWLRLPDLEGFPDLVGGIGVVGAGLLVWIR